MSWLTWRQFRLQAGVAVASLALAAVVVGASGAHLRDLYNASAVATCKVHGDCATVQATLSSHESLLRNLLGPLTLALPILIGIFWGAPLLARELESATYRLAWTQSVTRTRWLASKITLIGLASIVAVGLFSLMVSWWFSPIDKLTMNRLSPGVFDERGIVAIGYAAFAFALAVAAGALIRRTLPAMAVALLAFIGVRLAVTYWLREHLMPPIRLNAPLRFGSNLGFETGPSGLMFASHDPTLPNAWVLSSRLIDKAGQAPTRQALHRFLQTACPNSIANPGSEEAFQACLKQLSARFHLSVTYQPANRFWPLQGLETTLFLALALLLVGSCFWLVRQRLA
jgi:ABC-2 family transporter protein